MNIKPETLRNLQTLNPNWEAIVFETAARIAGDNEDLTEMLEHSLTEAVEQAVTAAE